MWITWIWHKGRRPRLRRSGLAVAIGGVVFVFLGPSGAGAVDVAHAAVSTDHVPIASADHVLSTSVLSSHVLQTSVADPPPLGSAEAELVAEVDRTLGSAPTGVAPRGHDRPAADLPAQAARLTGRRTTTRGDSSSAWVWPLAPPPEVERRFDPPPHPWGAGHRGVDLAGAEGQQVRSAGAGVVVYAGLLAGRGVVSVSHGALRTTYEPVAPTVRAGTRVAAGTVLGTLTVEGNHCRPTACLHWGLRHGERYLDPLALLVTGPPRLLPHLGQPHLGQPHLGQPYLGPPHHGQPPSAHIEPPPGLAGSGERVSPPDRVVAAPAVSTPTSARATESEAPAEDPSSAPRHRPPARGNVSPDNATGGVKRVGPGAAADLQIRGPGSSSAATSLTAFVTGAVAGAVAATLVVRVANARRGSCEGPVPRPPAPPGSASSAGRTVVPLRRIDHPPRVAA